MPLAEQCLAVGFIQVPELDINGSGRLYLVTFFVNRLYMDNQRFEFTVFIFIVKISISANFDCLQLREIFELDFLGQACEDLYSLL